MVTLEVGPKSNLVIYELMPTRRRKAIPVQIGPQHHDESVGLAFSADGKLLATLLPEMANSSATQLSSSDGGPLVSSNMSAAQYMPPPSLNSYAITVYLWRTGKTLASISLGSPSLPTISPQVGGKPTIIYSRKSFSINSSKSPLSTVP